VNEHADGGPTAGPVELQAGGEASLLTWDERGYVTGVVQDASDGRVLMVGWLDAEAVAATLATGEVHFHSRSRGRLWRKGETSGNVLQLRGLAIDCDGDALLLTVDPVGPTCHRGTRSCFDAEGAPAAREPVAGQGFAWLESLWSVIERRAAERPAGSYTVRLLEGGVDVVGRKVAEEATELLIAAKNDDAAEAAGLDRTEFREAFVGEAADLVYHAIVLLAERGTTPSLVIEALRRREKHIG